MILAPLLLALATAAPLERAALEPLLKPLYDDGWLSGALVVATITPAGTKLHGFGKVRDGGAAPDDRTIFEIGSVSKVFTSLALAAEVAGRRLTLDTPVARLLPKAVKVPEIDGRAITLADLATHHSGLPRLPANLAPKDPTNPYKGYGTRELYAFLSEHTLSRKPGARYEYSNLGAGLLGHALVLATRQPSYEALVVSRLAGHLGMTDTRVTVSAADRARVAEGHDADANPAPAWDLEEPLAGAGAIRSTGRDLVRFVQAHLAGTGPLAPAMALATQPRADAEGGHKIGLGWHLSGDLVWHNGQTGGYHSFVGYDRKRREGVVILAACSLGSLDGLGRMLLKMVRGEPPEMPRMPRTVKLPAERLAGLVGDFTLAPGFVLHVDRDARGLWAQATGQPRFRLWPDGDSSFYLRVTDARIDFERDKTGRADRLVLHQGGRDMPAPRTPAEPQKTKN